MTTKIINFDKTDIRNTSPEQKKINRLKNGFTVPSETIFKGLFFSTIKSPIFWIICFSIPIFSYFFIFLIVGIGVESTPSNETYEYSIASDIWWLAFGTPLIIMTIIIFPNFLISSRESSLFKRMSTLGISKIQIYANYMLASIAIFGTTLFLMTFLIPLLMNQITWSIIPHENSEVHVNVIESIFGKANFWFYILLLFGTLGSISMGYRRGMKLKTTSKSMMLGLGIWVFITFISSSDALFALTSKELWEKLQEFQVKGEMTMFSQILLYLVFLFFKFAYILNPISLLVIALAVTIIDSNDGSTSLYSNNELTYYFTILSSTFISIYYIVSVAWKSEIITNYETTR